MNQDGRDAHASVSECGVGSGHIHRRRVVSAQRHGWGGFDAGDSGIARKICHLVVTDLLGQFHRGIVQGHRKRITRGDWPVVLLFVIARLVNLVTIRKCGRGIVNHRNRGDDGLGGVAGERGVDRGSIHKRFEDGSGGSFSERVIELANSVVAPSRERQNVSSVRINGDQRNLRVGSRSHLSFKLALGHSDAFAALLEYLRVHQFDAFLDGLSGGALQIRIKRGVNTVGLVVDFAFIELGEKRIANHVNEVRRFAGFHIRRRQLQRRGFCFVSLRTRDGMGVKHGFQHQIAAFERALWMAIG